MALFKAVENGKLKLTDNYALDEVDLDENFGEPYKVGPDKQFTIKELAKIMLEQSDNTAMQAVIHIFNKIEVDNPLADIYSDGIGNQQSGFDSCDWAGAQLSKYQFKNFEQYVFSTL